MPCSMTCSPIARSRSSAPRRSPGGAAGEPRGVAFAGLLSVLAELQRGISCAARGVRSSPSTPRSPALPELAG